MKFLYWIRLNFGKFFLLLVFIAAVYATMSRFLPSFDDDKKSSLRKKPSKITIEGRRKKTRIRQRPKTKRRARRRVKKQKPRIVKKKAENHNRHRDDRETIETLSKKTQTAIIEIQKELSKSGAIEPEELAGLLEEYLEDNNNKKKDLSKKEIIEILPPMLKEILLAKQKEPATKKDKTVTEKKPEKTTEQTEEEFIPDTEEQESGPETESQEEDEEEEENPPTDDVHDSKDSLSETYDQNSN